MNTAQTSGRRKKTAGAAGTAPTAAARRPAALIEAHSLAYSAGEARIIDDISLSVGRGEFVGLIGPNGAGKTTLLRLLVGILAPSAGQIFLGGKPLSTYRPRERARRTSYLSQEASTAFPFPVLDILLMGRYPFQGRFRRVSESDLQKARRALSYVGLSGLEQRYFTELSGGERQLVLFARILVQETELLLLDEPTSNLDIKHQDQFFSMAAELSREKKAVIAAVHNLNVASQYCSSLVLLDRGRVAAAGRCEEVLRPEVLDPVYDTRTLVTRSASTGSLLVNVAPRARHKRKTSPLVHLIGGAGSAVNLTRELMRLGFRLSGGIAHEHDADQELWRNLEVPFHSVGAFSRIEEEDVRRAAHLVENADLTILCNFPIGSGNEGNLELARRARRLILLNPTERRSFFSAGSRELLAELERTAGHYSYPALCEALQSGELFSGRRK